MQPRPRRLPRFKFWFKRPPNPSIQLVSPSQPSTAAGETTQATTFEEAFRSHLSTLDQTDREYLFSSGPAARLEQDGLEEHLRRLRLEYKNRFSTRALNRIFPIIEHVQSFTKVVSMLVSSNPQIAALIWGGIQLFIEVQILRSVRVTY